MAVQRNEILKPSIAACPFFRLSYSHSQYCIIVTQLNSLIFLHLYCMQSGNLPKYNKLLELVTSTNLENLDPTSKCLVMTCRF